MIYKNFNKLKDFSSTKQIMSNTAIMKRSLICGNSHFESTVMFKPLFQTVRGNSQCKVLEIYNKLPTIIGNSINEIK